MSSSSSFDAYQQNVTFMAPDGITPIFVPVQDIVDWFYYDVKCSILYGVQAGACLVMFFVVACLTRTSQRKKPLHILNLLSLGLGFFRMLLLAIFFTSPWSSFYAFFTQDASRLGSGAYASSIAATIIPLLMTITVNVSLVFQARAVAKTHEPKYYYTLCALSVAVLMLAVGFRFAECVTNSMAILSTYTHFYDGGAWIQTGALATETVSIWFFSMVFTWKLFWTLVTRHKQGWKNATPMQILMIMSSCTMVIPSIFAILEHVSLTGFPEAGTLALTMVALMLPLSSLWAAMVTTSQTSSFNLSSLVHSRSSQEMHDSLESGRKTFASQYLSGCSGSVFASSDRKPSLTPISPTTIKSIVEVPPHAHRDSTELDLEAMGVRVARSYSINSLK